MNFLKLFKILSAPLIFSVLLFNINPRLTELKARTKTTPATTKDLDFYRRMGITYVCSASAKGSDLDFEKSLSVAANLFTTVVQQRHGGLIKEGKNKAQKIDSKVLQTNVFMNLLGGSMAFCPDNVTENMKELFKENMKKIQELKK